MEFQVPLPSQPFDVALHPTQPLVFAGLLTGQICAFYYDNAANYKHAFTLHPSRKSCRSISLNEDGSSLFSGGRGKSLAALDVATQKVLWTRLKAHNTSINRVKCLSHNFHLLASGDDDGGISIWDTREDRRTAVRTFSHHVDLVTDLLPLNDSRQLVATSGDGTLSVLDLRSGQKPFLQSEDQEDELLCLMPMEGARTVVGTQSGVLSIWDRRKGWGDCVDRALGHPTSVDCICPLPESFGLARGIITGSSDGLVRVSQVLPTKLVGVLTEYADWPVERIAVSYDKERPLLVDTGLVPVSEGSAVLKVEEAVQKSWVASISHDASIRFSDLGQLFQREEEQAESESSKGDESPSDELPKEPQKSRKRKGKERLDDRDTKRSAFFGELS